MQGVKEEAQLAARGLFCRMTNVLTVHPSQANALAVEVQLRVCGAEEESLKICSGGDAGSAAAGANAAPHRGCAAAKAGGFPDAYLPTRHHNETDFV